MGYRILHAIRSVNPVGGGPIEGLKQISAINLSYGNTVEVVSLDAPGDPWVREFPTPCHALGPPLLGYGYSSRYVPWLRANRHRYDVVIVNGIWQYSSFGTWRALAGTKTPYFVFTHGMLDPWFKRTYPFKHLKKWMYWPWAEYRVLRDAAAVLFTCEEERRQARRSFCLYHCNEYIVNYGTGAPVGDALRQRQAFYEKFPHLAGKRCLLFLGRVHPKKGPDLLFNAAAEVLTRLPPSVTKDLHIVMAGPNDHPYGRKMAKLVESLGLQDRVTWTGMVTGDLKWGAFHSADAFILPSHQENFGIAVGEALACGVPVLISNQVNIWREVRQDGGGLVDTDDIFGTARLIEGWLNMDRTAWNVMRTQAKACFESRFRIERTARSLIQAFRSYGVILPAEQNLKDR